MATSLGHTDDDNIDPLSVAEHGTEVEAANFLKHRTEIGLTTDDLNKMLWYAATNKDPAIARRCRFIPREEVSNASPVQGSNIWIS